MCINFFHCYYRIFFKEFETCRTFYCLKYSLEQILSDIDIYAFINELLLLQLKIIMMSQNSILACESVAVYTTDWFVFYRCDK